MLRLGLSIVLTAAMVTTMLVAPASAVMAGDTNGDRQVDVLDLQRIIAQVLARDAFDARADVNHDGRVDILDFQKVLDLARDKVHSEAPGPLPNQAVPVVASQAPLPMAEKAAIPFFTPGKRVTTAALRARSVPMRHSSAKVERYTLRLMPNAPPARA